MFCLKESAAASEGGAKHADLEYSTFADIASRVLAYLLGAVGHELDIVLTAGLGLGLRAKPTILGHSLPRENK